jgi:hypothetical protein
MQVVAIKGIVSVTLAIDSCEKQHISTLEPRDLLQLCTDQVATFIPAKLIKDAIIDFDGESVQLVFSL